MYRRSLHRRSWPPVCKRWSYPFRREQKYGSGGLIQGKQHMLSLTWNAPQEAFDDPEQFFHGQGVDGLYMHFHKANEFLGMTRLPTFLCTDVIKNPNVEHNIACYRDHLATVFANK
ncbi:MAG: NAD(P)H-dependent oxidoreductase [Enterobacterales bacterium]|nr:NAD(P)H-dependent oxidoreductase [Enterobacterales bacterium]